MRVNYTLIVVGGVILTMLILLAVYTSLDAARISGIARVIKNGKSVTQCDAGAMLIQYGRGEKGISVCPEPTNDLYVEGDYLFRRAPVADETGCCVFTGRPELVRKPDICVGAYRDFDPNTGPHYTDSMLPLDNVCGAGPCVRFVRDRSTNLYRLDEFTLFSGKGPEDFIGQLFDLGSNCKLIEPPYSVDIDVLDAIVALSKPGYIKPYPAWVGSIGE